jgi:hypothetical protein
MSTLSIDTVAAREAARFAREVVAHDLGDISIVLDRTARAAHLSANAAGALTLVHEGTDAAIGIATFLEQLAHAAEGADVSDLVREVADFFAGDVFSFWHGARDGFPYGQAAAGGLRTWRVFTWLTGPAGADVPVFSNGAIGTRLANILRSSPSTARVGTWLQTSGAYRVFRGAGIVGAALSTGAGAYELWQQGNPVDAFEREGAGYVADVAGTAFSAATLAFLVTANPVFATIAIGAGIVWIGAEVWDAWGDEISAWVGDRIDDLGTAAGAAWDAGSGAVADAWSATTDLASAGWDAAGDAAGAAWDAGSGFVDGVGDALGGAFGGIFG